MSGGTFGPEAEAFTASVKPIVYEKPLDMRLLSARLRDLAEGREIESRGVVPGACTGERTT